VGLREREGPVLFEPVGGGGGRGSHGRVWVLAGSCLASPLAAPAREEGRCGLGWCERAAPPSPPAILGVRPWHPRTPSLWRGLGGAGGPLGASLISNALGARVLGGNPGGCSAGAC